MFTPKKETTEYTLTGAIDDVLESMAGYDPTTEEYAELVVQLDKLYKMKVSDKPDRFSYDTVLTVAANILGIALILKHEQLNVIATKALGFVLKTKV